MQIPLVDDEMRIAAGEGRDEDTAMVQGSVQKLVTADGTYATQSAFSSTASVKKDVNRCVTSLGQKILLSRKCQTYS